MDPTNRVVLIVAVAAIFVMFVILIFAITALILNMKAQAESEQQAIFSPDNGGTMTTTTIFIPKDNLDQEELMTLSPTTMTIPKDQGEQTPNMSQQENDDGEENLERVKKNCFLGHHGL